MGANLLRDDLIARWADLLVDYCLKVERGETILIGSELEARPLVEAASRAVILRGRTRWYAWRSRVARVLPGACRR